MRKQANFSVAMSFKLYQVQVFLGEIHTDRPVGD
jgi:hypothetical protein